MPPDAVVPHSHAEELKFRFLFKMSDSFHLAAERIQTWSGHIYVFELSLDIILGFNKKWGLI